MGKLLERCDLAGDAEAGDQVEGADQLTHPDSLKVGDEVMGALDSEQLARLDSVLLSGLRVCECSFSDLQRALQLVHRAPRVQGSAELETWEVGGKLVELADLRDQR
eukprot:355108-Rhodomonas_salina.1